MKNKLTLTKNQKYIKQNNKEIPHHEINKFNNPRIRENWQELLISKNIY
jgi:hypothetical protein